MIGNSQQNDSQSSYETPANQPTFLGGTPAQGGSTQGGWAGDATPAAPWTPQPLFPAQASEDEGYDSDGTDSDTESSVGDTEYDYSEYAGLSNATIAQILFAKMSHYKGQWRSFMNKPVRRFRRYFRKKLLPKKGKGRGKGRLTGKGITAWIAGLSDDEYEETLFGRGRGKGKGKRKGTRSSGKGAGRRMNPRGKDGKIMECLGNNGRCKSQYHLKRDCPYERQ